MKERKRHRTLLALLIVVLVLVVLAVVLLETAFFHLNPIKVGYRSFDFGRYVVFSTESKLDADYKKVSRIMDENEASYGLQYLSKVQIIICKRQTDIDRFQPFASEADRKNAVAFAPWPNTIYVTPKLKGTYRTVSATLAHELSHLLLLQNFGLIKTYDLWRLHEWIPEGFATYLADWPSYFPATDLAKNMKLAGIDLASGDLLGGKKTSEVALPLRFMIYRNFVDFLFRNFGADVTGQFLRSVCRNPGDMQTIFQSAFGISFADCVRNFSLAIQAVSSEGQEKGKRTR
ncbi:MAG TPA: hypothetical protein VL354_09595 [Spirochaetia bacterium]|nr:hypothetical protein [Spirochaetia bacterium]